MSIQQKINSLKPYVKAMRFYQDFPVIDASFKKGWKVPEGKIIKFVKDEKTGIYTFLCENKNVGFDELLEYVEQIITFNVDLEKKQELFKIKSKELQKIFLSTENKYEDLINLEFSFSNKKEEKETEITLFDGDITDDEIIKKEVIKKSVKEVDDKKVVKKVKTKVNSNQEKNIKKKEDDNLPPLAETDQPKFEL